MKVVAVVLATVLLVTAQLSMGVSFDPVVPSFLWSPHQHRSDGVESVNYKTLSPKDLAKSVMSEGGWSNFLCSGKGAEQHLDIGLIFVGKELQSTDLSKPRKADSVLINFLKDSFVNSNFSLAFPYIAISEEGESVERSLISEFTDTCGDNLETSRVAFSESCSVEGEDFEKLSGIPSIQSYLVSRMEKKSKGHSDLIVLCDSDSNTLAGTDNQASESRLLAELISYVEHLGAKYTVLYVSDPSRSIQYPSHRELERFLVEGRFGSGSGNSTCDEVCQLKSTFLEGIMVAVVLLIILISGLCCMMGIDTPTRFEAPVDS
nr:uncharacterized protein LOC109160369 [Ipomoea batatas]